MKVKSGISPDANVGGRTRRQCLHQIYDIRYSALPSNPCCLDLLSVMIAQPRPLPCLDCNEKDCIESFENSVSRRCYRNFTHGPVAPLLRSIRHAFYAEGPPYITVFSEYFSSVMKIISATHSSNVITSISHLDIFFKPTLSS